MSDFIKIVSPDGIKYGKYFLAEAFGSEEDNIVEIETAKTNIEIFFLHLEESDRENIYVKKIEIDVQKINNKLSFSLKPFMQSMFFQEKDQYRYKESIKLDFKKANLDIIIDKVTKRIPLNVFKGRDFTKVSYLKKPLFKGYPQSLSFIQYQEDSVPDLSEIGIDLDSKFKGVVRMHVEDAVKIRDFKRLFTRTIDQTGIFIKWLNKFGTWSYWLFEDIYEETRKVKVGTIIDNPFHLLSGKDIIQTMPNTVTKNWRLQSITPVHADEFEELNTLFESTQVYLYTGVKNTTGRRYEIDPDLWKRVYLSDITSKHVIDKHSIFDFEVTINFRDNE